MNLAINERTLVISHEISDLAVRKCRAFLRIKGLTEVGMSCDFFFFPPALLRLCSRWGNVVMGTFEHWDKLECSSCSWLSKCLPQKTLLPPCVPLRCRVWMILCQMKGWTRVSWKTASHLRARFPNPPRLQLWTATGEKITGFKSAYLGCLGLNVIASHKLV